jgi:hypothetical protein
MVATPYLLLGLFLFFIYRGFKKLQQAEAARTAADFPDVAGPVAGPDLPALPPPGRAAPETP